MPNENSAFVRLIEASLADLLTYGELEWPSFELRSYYRVLCAYLQNDREILAAEVAQIEPGVLQKLHGREISLAIRLRLKIRQLALSQNDLAAASSEVASWSQQNIWQGELSFILARGFEVVGDWRGASTAYERAARQLEMIGAARKSLKADFNAMASESNTDLLDAKHLIGQSHWVYLCAKKLGDDVVAGLALLSLSRCYQRAGALALALDYAERALNSLESDFGALNYQLALAQRCHVLVELKRFREAEPDDMALSASDFPEILQARQVIHASLGLVKAAQMPLRPTWRERWNLLERQPLEQEAMADMETRLIDLLGQGPKSKDELIKALFGEGLDYQVCDNRFWSLFNRLRRKRPDLIEKNQGRYFLAEKIAFYSIEVPR